MDLVLWLQTYFTLHYPFSKAPFNSLYSYPSLLHQDYSTNYYTSLRQAEEDYRRL